MTPRSSASIARGARRTAGLPEFRSDQHGIDVLLSTRTRLNPAMQRELRRIAGRIVAIERFRTGSLSIVVLGSKAMCRLHERFLNDPTITDVITFDLGTNLRQRHLEGEIYICHDVAQRVVAARRRQHATGPIATSIAARNRALFAELALYVTHGILHLAGYDDHSAADFRKMHRREAQILAQLGLMKEVEEIVE